VNAAFTPEVILLRRCFVDLVSYSVVCSWHRQPAVGCSSSIQAVAIALPVLETVIAPALAVAVLLGNFQADAIYAAVANTALRVRAALRPWLATCIAAVPPALAPFLLVVPEASFA
jgi:hypothetical protein